MKFKLIFGCLTFLLTQQLIGQDIDQKLNSLDQQLASGKTSVSKILSDPAHMNLAFPQFRFVK